MLAVNTNGISGDINLLLNNVKIDTDSKKAPAVYVYNKDINYTEHKVTIKTINGTKNYLEGGKFKKVSLVGSDELDNYTNYYSGTAKTNYTTYTNYYGIYKKSEIEKVLFAKVQADNEDLADGDPYYFYKGAGAISSDIDLYFEGEGYLSVISKNKEGIETKGNLTFSGGKGDYYVFAEDDCLNTTTSNTTGTTARNTLTIDVNSLTAMIDPEADEGDCIDSNGTLIINSGNIFAFAHPTSQDDGLDSDKGTYINGGTVVATGNMSDAVSEESKQDFIKLTFSSQQAAGTIVCITDTNSKPVMAFKSDRAFTTMTYSSSKLQKTTYYVYKNGKISGSETNGLYTNIESYTDGTQQQWTSDGNRMNENQPSEGNNENPNNQGTIPPQDGQNKPEENNQNGENPPEKPDGESQPKPNDENKQDITNNDNTQNKENVQTSPEFTLSATNHSFGNVANYENTSSGENKTETKSTNNTANNTITNNVVNNTNADSTTATQKLPNTGTNRIKLIITIMLLLGSAKLFYSFGKLNY